MNLQKINKIKNKQSIFFATSLVLVMTLSMLAALPSVAASDPPITIPTYAYVVVTPDPVGVNQAVFIVMWLDKAPPTAAGIGGDRWQDFEIKITKPDGSVEVLGPFTSDSTSSTFTTYTPSTTGVYKVDFSFPGQKLSLYNPTNGVAGTNSPFINDTFAASTASTAFTVQQDQIAYSEDFGLPKSFWTRPIEGQNNAWAAVASNWLGSPQIVNYLQPSGAAPATAHVMWTKPFSSGGLVGGNFAVSDAATFYTGLSYETKFSSALIIDGKLYYTLPRSNTATGNGYVCVDLVTGETLWQLSDTMPSFAQLYDYESMNQHGVINNGYMWRSVNDASNGGTVWMAFDPIDGKWLFNETNVPSGTQMYGPNGEILIYQLNVANKWLALWNNTAAPTLAGATDTSSAAFQWRPVGKNVNASTAYNWNVTIPQLPTGSSILKVIPDDTIIGSANFPAIYSAIGSSFGVPANTTRVVWALSLKPESRGQLLWQKVYPLPDGNLTRALGAVDPVNRIFTMTDKETMQWLGFDLDNGEKLWGPVGNTTAYQYYGNPMFPGQTGYVYQGKLYVGGYGGILYCYDITSGNLIWTYGNGGVGNSTNSGLDNPWGHFPTFPCGFADGKIYLYTTEHSPNTPPYKGSRVRCVDAETGQEIWTMMSWSSSAFAIADGYAVYLNTYDMQLYCIGKGPSKTTVGASAAPGNVITVQGQITDVSAGAKKLVDSGEFTAVPVISDESIGKWMEYIHMQKPKPTDATGVQVKLTATDTDGHTYDIGNAITDLNGKYGLSWTPPAAGTYKIDAIFESTNSYWGSEDSTYIAIGSAIAPDPTTEPTQSTTQEPTDGPIQTPSQTTSPASPTPAVEPDADNPTETLLIVGAAVVIIAVIGAAAVLLRKRK